MRILFIDDDIWRFEAMLNTRYLGDSPVYASDAFKAINLIINNQWDIIFFDHDLATFIDSYEDIEEINGNHVAKVLIEQNWKPSKVYIHSMNTFGAYNIKKTLDSAGIFNEVKPFYKFMEAASKI